MTPGDGPGFGELRSGKLGVRLARDAAEIDAVQALRYRVFYEEMGAHADAATAASRRDRDEFDAVADHLLVVDHDKGEGPESVVGTYRLIRRCAKELAVGGAETRRGVQVVQQQADERHADVDQRGHLVHQPAPVLG